MRIGGLVLMALGVIVMFLGFGGGVTASYGMGLLVMWAGAAIFSLGVLLAIAGAVMEGIVEAIDRANAANTAELRGLRDDLRKGIESLWAQLDRVRVNTAPPDLPVLSARPDAGGAA